MSRPALAIETVKYCLWAISFATGSSHVASAEKAFSKTTSLAKAIGAAQPDPAASAASALLDLLDGNPEFSDDAIEAATALLQEKQGAICVETDLLKSPEARQDFPAALYDHLFAKAPPPKEGRVDDILRAVISAAFQELRKEDTYNKLFVQEGIAALEEGLGKMQSRLLNAVEVTVAEREELASLRTERKLLISVVQNFVPDAGEDFEGALASITSALATAAKRLELGTLSTNQGEAVDAIISDVRRLNRAGDTKGAMARLSEDAARRRAERERRIAADSRVLDEAIAQAELVNDAEAYAAFQLEKIQLGTPSAEEQFHQLRAIFIDRYQNGLRTGAPFLLTSAIDLARQCESVAPTAYLKAMAKNDAGIALQNQGTRTAGARGSELLAQAVAAYDAALEIRTEQDRPVQWATTQNNKGTALRDQGIRTEGVRAAALLAEAVEAYDASLQVHTRTAHPLNWAMTQNNKGGALEEQGIRTDGAWGTALLAKAVEAYDAALEIYTRRDHPVEWAITQNNKGNALRYQGTLTEGAPGAAILARAVAVYDAALEVRSRQHHPMRWAMTHLNLAMAKEAWARHDSAQDLRALLQEALAHVDAALNVFDPEHMSYNHAKATRVRDRIRSKLDALS